MSLPQGPPRRERRWTIVVVPHSTEASRSFALSERALRGVGWFAGIVGLAAVLAVTAMAMRIRETDRALASAWRDGDREVDSLRARLDSLRQSITGIQSQESRIRHTVGVAPTESPSFWARVLRSRPDSAAPEQGRVLSVVRDSLRREIRAVTKATDSLVVRAGDVSGKAQRMADSLTGATGRRP